MLFTYHLCPTVRLEPLHLPIERVFMMGWFVLASIAAAVSETCVCSDFISRLRTSKTF